MQGHRKVVASRIELDAPAHDDVAQQGQGALARNVQVTAQQAVGDNAQRLVRVNCVHCATEEKPDSQLIADSGLTREQVQDFVFRTGRGCGHCRGTGFKGRRAIGEILCLNDEIRELIVAREPIRRIREAAARHGTRFLRDAAVELVRSGETTLQEINRVTFVA